MEQKQSLIVNGYAFKNEEEAEVARNEVKKIEYIERRLNYQRPLTVFAVYKKALDEKAFQTPVGLQYMTKLYHFLANNEHITQEIPPVPLQNYYSRTVRENVSPTRQRIQPVKKKDTLKYKYRVSIMLNIALFVMVFVMFWIAFGAKSPNMINYERTLVDKYAQWEQELNEREATVREREKQLEETD